MADIVESKADMDERRNVQHREIERRKAECDCKTPIKGRKYFGIFQCVSCGRGMYR